jgi:hypothetical protein
MERMGRIAPWSASVGSRVVVFVVFVELHFNRFSVS